MSYKLKELPYSFDALEPFIDARTMEIHYTKHHANYVSKLNDALDQAGNISEKSLNEILSSLSALTEDLREIIKNNGGGHINHELFWSILTPDYKEPSGLLMQKIEENFESFDKFKDEFTKSALNRFGSGWTWLVLKNGQLEILST